MSDFPIKYEQSMRLKIRNLFTKIVSFFKKEKLTEKETETIKENYFANSLQNDIKKGKNINNIINIIEEHPEILDNLPIEKLEKIDLMYNEKIDKNQNEINELIRKIEWINKK